MEPTVQGPADGLPGGETGEGRAWQRDTPREVAWALRVPCWWHRTGRRARAGGTGAAGWTAGTRGAQAAASTGTGPCLVGFSISCENLPGKVPRARGGAGRM